jgi:hypothetical protein
MITLASMDGNNAKKAPLLDELVGTHKEPSNHKSKAIPQRQYPQAKPVLATMNGTINGNDANHVPTPAHAVQNSTTPTAKAPQNRRTDKSEFEIELAHTVNKIMLEHFENASEEIVKKVLSEVRARLPGQRKS